jgi:hypothetical protein
MESGLNWIRIVSKAGLGVSGVQNVRVLLPDSSSVVSNTVV